MLSMISLLIRDAACAARSRARNAWRHRNRCSDSARADVEQLAVLVDQMRAAAPIAVAQGELPRWKQWYLEAELRRAERSLASGRLHRLLSASHGFGRRCRDLRNH